MSGAARAGIELAITASSRVPSLALRDQQGQVHVVAPHDRSAGDLTNLIAESFTQWGHGPEALTSIRLDLGPGSYTGLRVAVTFARTCRQFQDVTIHTCTSLELMALSALREDLVATTDQVRPVLDARRRRFHHALVAMDGLRVVQDPSAVEIETLHQQMQRGEVILAAQPLHAALAPKAAELGARLIEPPPWDARLMFDERLHPIETDSADLEPLYLMGSYAE